jgi:uncharacterized membrane protein
VIEPKLMLPRVHAGTLRRTRLLEMLDDDGASVLTLLDAGVGYGKTTLALAQKDFDALVKLVEEDELKMEGVVLVTVDPDGTVAVKETGDHLGRKGVKVGAAVGLAVGLFAPPLLAATVVGGAVGGVVGKFAKHRVESGLEEKMGDALPPGSAGIVAIYDRAQTDAVNTTLANSVRKSVAQVDGGRAQELKAAPGKHKPGWVAK